MGNVASDHTTSSVAYRASAAAGLEVDVDAGRGERITAVVVAEVRDGAAGKSVVGIGDPVGRALAANGAVLAEIALLVGIHKLSDGELSDTRKQGMKEF